MRNGRTAFRRRHWASFCMVGGAAAWWVATAWVARQPNPSLIGLTNNAFVVALVWSYLAGWSVVISLAPDARTATFRAGAVTLATIVGVMIILEAPSAADLLDYRRIRETFIGSEGPDVGFVDDRELVYRRIPNAHWTGRPRTDMASYFNLPFRAAQPLTFSTDGDGFRNPNTPKRADIALIGDSYVEGITVSDEETSSARLHDLTGLTVANLGVAGYGTLQELTVLRKYALPLHPALIAWFFFEGNDLDDDQNFENSMLAHQPASTVSGSVVHPPAWRRWRGFADRSFTWNAFLQIRQWANWLVPNGLNTFGWFRERSGQLDKMYFYDFYATRPLTDYERKRLEVTRTTLRQAEEICLTNHIQFVLFYVPIKFRVYGDLCKFPEGSPCVRWRPWDLESRIAALCRDAGIEFVSLTDRMREAAVKGDLLYLPDDSHWNAAGQTFVANELAHVWASHGLAPAATSQQGSGAH